MRSSIKLLVLLGCLTLPVVTCMAQMQVKVFTKTIERTFDYTTNNSIMIRGEKSQIIVHGWTNNQVKVKLKLISKAKSEDVAKRELEYQKYILEKKKENIRIANFYQVPGNKKIEAILLAEYEIWVPMFAELKIDNSYGNISLSKTKGSVKLTNRFGNLLLDEISGIGDYQCHFGDFTARGLDGNNNLKFNKIRTTIDGLSGILQLDSNLGDITIMGLKEPVGIDIKAAKSDINLELVASWEKLSYNFRSEFGAISLPEQIPGIAKKRGNVTYWVQEGNGQSKVNVETNFGMINLSK